MDKPAWEAKTDEAYAKYVAAIKWEAKTDEAYAKYVAAIKEDLGPEANFQEMEQAILKHSRELLRANLESLASDEAFSPSAKSDS